MIKRLPTNLHSFLKNTFYCLLLLTSIPFSAQPENLTDCEGNYEDIMSTPNINDWLLNIGPPDFSEFPGAIRIDNYSSEIGFAYNSSEFYYYQKTHQEIVFDSPYGEIVTPQDVLSFIQCDFENLGFYCTSPNGMIGFNCLDFNGNNLGDLSSNYTYITIWNYNEPIPSVDNDSELDLCNPCEKEVCIDKDIINQSMVCTFEYNPVCGCDGKTYSNGCVAEFYFGVKEYTNGACDKSICIDSTKISTEYCTYEYAPVCGCNGVTYPNACSASNSGVLKYTDGPCSNECIDLSIKNVNGTIYCPHNYTPVCGCNNVSYPNECYALMDGVKDFIYGTCEDIDCDSIIYVPLPIPDPNTAQDTCSHLGYNPVCGCDEMTYDNECFAFANGIKYFVQGECDSLICQEENLNYDFPCPAVIDSVCGCNGISYNNECEAIRDGVRDWIKGPCNSGECVDLDDILLCDSWLYELIEESITENSCSSMNNISCFTEVRRGQYNNQDVIIIHRSCSDGMYNHFSDTYAYDCSGKLIDKCSSFSLAIWCDASLANGIIIENLINEQIIWDCNHGLPNCDESCEVPNSYLGETNNITETSARFRIDQLNYSTYDWRYKLKSKIDWIDLDSTTSNFTDINNLIRCESYVWQFRVKCESGLWSEWLGNYCFETTCIIEPCYLPSNYELAEDLKTQTSIRIIFNPDNYAKYQWRIKNKNTNTWQPISDSNDNAIDIFGLSPCTEYSFQLRVQCNDEQWSEWITEYCFTTECPEEPCQIPLNYELSNSLQTQTSIRVSFTPDNYEKYDWRYRKAGASTWIELNPSEENYYDFFALDICADYEFEVRVDCGDSNWTDWFGSHNFSTQCPPDPCDIPSVFEFNNIVDNNTTRVIFSSSNYYAYDWRYKTKNAVDWEPVIQTSANFLDLNNLDVCEEYLLEIKVACEPDSWSDWFGENCFSTYCPPEPCEIPSGYSLDTTLTTETSIQILFDQDQFEFYDWRYRPISETDWIELDSTDQSIINLFGLTSCQEYELQLRVRCEINNWSPWFEEFYFKTACPIMACEINDPFTAEAIMESDNSIRLSINLSNYLYYDWRIKLKTENDWMPLDSTNSNFININDLEECAQYDWSIRVACNQDNWSQWYEQAPFDSYCPPICEAPLTNTIGISLLTQSSVRLEFAPANYLSYLWRYRVVGGDWMVSDTTTLSFIDLTLLDPCQEYQWQIKIACDNDNWSEWFGFDEFETHCPPPKCELDFVYGLFVEEVEENSAELNIDNFNFGRYRWQYKKENDDDWTFVGESGTNLIIIDDLDHCTTYQWQVSIQCDSGEWSQWFGYGLFETKCPVISCAINTDIDFNTINIGTNEATFQATNASFEAYHWRVKKSGINTWELLDTTSINSLVYNGLDACKKYTWQVKVKCNDNLWSNWNGINDFETLCEVDDCDRPQSFALSSSELNSISFELKIDNFTYPLYDWRYKEINSSIWEDLDSTSTNSVVISNLDTCASYNWQLRVACDIGQWSEWFGDENLMTSCPDLECFVSNGFFLTEDNITTNSARLISDIPNQAQYQYEFKLRSELQYTRTDSVPTGTFELTDLISCEKYDWRVRVQCTNGIWSDWKGVANFDTGCLSAIAENNYSDVSIYPNPSFGLINLKTQNPIDQILVYNLQGKLMASCAATKQINLGEMDTGIYLINVLIDDQWTVHKIVKL